MWLQRCEAVCAMLRQPTSFALLPSVKNEDRLVVDCRGTDALWGVFDGHRSHEVSAYASRTLPNLIWGSTLTDPAEVLRTAVRDCHERARLEGLRGGSTAVVVATQGELLWCCSAGDSRAVLGLRGGGVRRFSVDHRTNEPEEQERIQAAGGRLEWGRLGGFLPVSRGLGNFDLEADGFTCAAHVAVLPRHEVDFVIVASDGLWDVVSDEEACDLVRCWGDRCTSAAEQLAQYARTVKESPDDIAVVIAGFPRAEGAGLNATAISAGA